MVIFEGRCRRAEVLFKVIQEMNLVYLSSWCIVAAFFLITRVSKGTFFDMKPSVKSYLPNYEFYHNITMMNECLHHISAQYSELVDVQMRYRSRLGLSQYVLRISNFSLDSIIENKLDRRSRILLSYGEHAAEFFPVQSLFHLLQNVTQGIDLPPGTYGSNFTRFLLNNFDLYLVTIVNPDGRVIIEQTRNYCWTGTANNADLNSDLDGKFADRNIAGLFNNLIYSHSFFSRVLNDCVINYFNKINLGLLYYSMLFYLNEYLSLVLFYKQGIQSQINKKFHPSLLLE